MLLERAKASNLTPPTPHSDWPTARLEVSEFTPGRKRRGRKRGADGDWLEEEAKEQLLRGVRHVRHVRGRDVVGELGQEQVRVQRASRDDSGARLKTLWTVLVASTVRGVSHRNLDVMHRVESPQ